MFLMKITWLLADIFMYETRVAVARNPPTCPAEKRSLAENLMNDRWIECSAQVRLRTEWKGDSISLFEISPGIGWRANYSQVPL